MAGEITQLSCSLTIPEVSGLQSQQLTVGRHFAFVCEGNIGDFDLSKAQLVLAENDKYNFSLIKAVQNPNHSGAAFDMVSYMTGEIKMPELKVTDTKSEITLKIQPVTITSILPPPQKNAEGQAVPPEPFGYNILTLPWPMGYTAFFILVFCAIFAGIILFASRARRFRRLALELKDYDSAISPDQQFYKHIRLLEKKGYPILEVERQFRIYVTRRYQVPLFGLSVGEATSYLKKTWPTLPKERRDLKNILSDLKKMSNKENPEETKKYLTKLYQFVDHSEDKIGGHS